MRALGWTIGLGVALVGAWISVVSLAGIPGDWATMGQFLDGLPEGQRHVALAAIVSLVVVLALFPLVRRAKKGASGDSLVQEKSPGSAAVQNSPNANVRIFNFLASSQERSHEIVVRPSERFEYRNHWEVLEDLPWEHRRVLWDLLQVQSQQLDLSSELIVLGEHGLVELRMSLDRYRAVFAIPRSLRKLVEEFFSEESVRYIEDAVRKALQSSAGREFLGLFTALDKPDRMTFDAWLEGRGMSGQLLTGAWVVRMEESRTPQQARTGYTFTLSGGAAEVLCGELDGRPIVRMEVTFDIPQIKGFDHLIAGRPAWLFLMA